MEYNFLKNDIIRNFLSQFEEKDKDIIIEELLLMSINKINEDSAKKEKEEIIEQKPIKEKGKILILDNDARNKEQILQNSLEMLNNNFNFTCNKNTSFEEKFNKLNYKLNNLNQGSNSKKNKNF